VSYRKIWRRVRTAHPSVDTVQAGMKQDPAKNHEIGNSVKTAISQLTTLLIEPAQSS
jgi:hypothetical protein